MRSKLKLEPSVWMMFECGAGTRWTSTTEDHTGEVCNFSGCNCGTIVRKRGVTGNHNVAGNWFRRPETEKF